MERKMRMLDLNCALCKKPIIEDTLVYDTTLKEVLCCKCASLLNTCYSCHSGESCDFETNLSPLPKQVQATRRMGNTVMSQVIRNPERVKITCENGCPCWSAEFGCGKNFCVENRFCPNEHWVWKYKENKNE